MSEIIDENKEKTSDKEKSSFFGQKGIFFLIWIICFIVVSVIFLVKLDDIKTNFKNTQFFERIFGKEPVFADNTNKDDFITSEFGGNETVINIDKISEKDLYYGDLSEKEVESYVWNQENSVADDNFEVITKDDVVTENENLEAKDNVSEAEKRFDDVFENLNDEIASENIAENVVSESESVVEIPVKKEVSLMNAKLWFSFVDSDGRISRKQSVRRIARVDAPLTNNIKLLLQGPNVEELDDGCLSLIPSGTRLLTALVKDGVAYLNFSSEFEVNRIGGNGYLAQLQQVIFTSTEFPTVQKVQILIDGQKKETLGDGIWIGSPLSRDNFQ